MICPQEETLILALCLAMKTCVIDLFMKGE
jgi:hypothetical protein